MYKKITFVILVALCRPTITHAQQSNQNQTTTKDSSPITTQGFDHSQIITTIYNKTTTKDSTPITTQGINISQFITTNYKRANLRFDFITNTGNNLSLFGTYNKFISDKNKQINIFGRLGTIADRQDLEAPQDNSWNASAGINVKLFKEKNFLDLELDNFAYKPRRFNKIVAFNQHTASIGVGRGRIDFVNDASIAQRIVKKLIKHKRIKQDLTKKEFTSLVAKIAEIKNERKFENRSYSPIEPMQIAMLLSELGIAEDKSGDIEELISDAFVYEPIIDRTTGSQWKASIYGRISLFHNITNQTSYNNGLKISWMKHKYINEKWQWNFGASTFSQFNRTTIQEKKVKLMQATVQFESKLHYFINDNSRLSLINTWGTNLYEEFLDSDFQKTAVNANVFYNTKLEYEFQTSRKTSVTIGAFVNTSSFGSDSGMSFGLKF